MTPQQPRAVCVSLVMFNKTHDICNITKLTQTRDSRDAHAARRTVGLPNVGKSSVINSLKRSKACNIGNRPGVTKTMQVVQLDSKIKLLDSPGIVFENSKNADPSAITLKNAVKIESLRDPFTPASAILKHISTHQLMELYEVHEFTTPEEFFAKKAVRMGKYKKGGIPDTLAAARGILTDWNLGKIS